MIKREYKLHQYFESLALIIISEITPEINNIKSFISETLISFAVLLGLSQCSGNSLSEFSFLKISNPNYKPKSNNIKLTLLILFIGKFSKSNWTEVGQKPITYEQVTVYLYIFIAMVSHDVFGTKCDICHLAKNKLPEFAQRLLEWPYHVTVTQ